MSKMVFIRHAQSVWNKEGKFTGWTDVDLSKEGILGAKEVSKIIKNLNIKFDLFYTSVLVRAIHTLEIILEELGLKNVDFIKDWRLNERHYGALQGESKRGKMKEVGEKQVNLWRRSYNTRPPELKRTDRSHPVNDLLYKDVDRELLPGGESLKDTIERVSIFLDEEIMSKIKDDKDILVSAHGNSLRAVVKILSIIKNDNMRDISDDEIAKLEIPFSMPMVCEFDKNTKVTDFYFVNREGEKIRDIFYFSGKDTTLGQERK